MEITGIEKKLNIVVASDENYAIHLSTLICSILENRRYEYSICFYVLDGGISETAKNCINIFCQKFDHTSIEYIVMSDDTICEKLGNNDVWGDRSLSTFSRLFIPDLLLNEKRALYLDVDAIVLGDLMELYCIDIQDYCVAGVKDIRDIKTREAVGLNENDLYVCAGVLLWNLELARNINFSERVREFVNLYNGKVCAMDQGIINGILSKKSLIKKIHPKYNTMTPFFFETAQQLQQIYGLHEYYTDDELKEACKNPVFVHFVSGGTTRPWEKHCKHPYKNEYWKYRNRISCVEKEYLSDKRTTKVRITDWIYRNIPCLFVRFVQRGKGWNH